MAKPTTIEIKLENPETGVFYLTKKNPRTKPEKIKRRKYDKKTRKHVEFVEKKV
ncbi:MAG: 50S ribosomal protein L33 [Lactobacillales bacterium]|jgi:large subunit ribosomal protein L33|nr:50S ribosomal protein L33 [Lactobacillales bacterium]